MAYDEAHRAKQLTNLLSSMNQPAFCDVTFVVGSKEERKSFATNRLFLSLISPVFTAMLYGEMKESKPNSKIEINDIKPAAFKSVLNYSYYNDPKLTPDNIVAIRAVADKYQISMLAELCDKYFSSCLDVQNICLLLSKSIAIKLDLYVAKCIQAIKSSFGASAEKVIKSDGFLAMNVETMILFLQIDELVIKEEYLWKYVVKWSSNQSIVKHAHCDETAPSHKRQKLNNGLANEEKKSNYAVTLLKQICPFVRFGLMNGNYFVKNVRPFNCLTHKEMTDILCHIQCNDEECGIFCVKPREKKIKIEPSAYSSPAAVGMARHLWNSHNHNRIRSRYSNKKS